MKVFNLDIENGKVLTDLPFERKRAVALGFFDALHKGHTDIIKSAVSYARANNLSSCVQTFADFPERDLPTILTLEERLEILTSLGVDEVVFINFSDEVKSTEATVFYDDIIRKTFNAEALFCGKDYSFGARKAGDSKLLNELSSKDGVKTFVFDDILFRNERISSTATYEVLKTGDVKAYRELCDGRFYSFTGIVNVGKRLGKSLGFPTINIGIPEKKFIPKFGVYASFVIVDGSLKQGITDLGLRPTAENSSEPRFETFIFDFDGDLYGKKVTVLLADYIREEKKFDSLEDLKSQISDDLVTAKVMFSKMNENIGNT